MVANRTENEACVGLTQNELQLYTPQRTALAQAVTLALVAVTAPGVVLAQEERLEEITVTATKRAESVMDVPLAITAMSGENIRELNLDSLKRMEAL